MKEAPKPPRIEPPAVSETLVKPLAEMLAASGLWLDLMRELEQKFVYNLFRPGQNLEETEEAVYQLLLNNQHLLLGEEERLLRLPEEDRGEAIFTVILANL